MTSLAEGRLRQIGQPVIDLERAVRFYGDVLGLRLIARPGPLAFFDLAGVRLLLQTDPDRTPAESILYFAVTDIRAAHAELAAKGVEFEHEPRLIHRDDDGVFGAAGEEEWMAFFRDSEGNLLALSSRETPA
jgi:methylmalonyl-CoA/ethylmalonyl-CoA epimerase